MAKLSTFIIALLFVGLFASVLMFFTIDLTSQYGVSYDNESILNYSDVSEIHQLSIDIERSTSNNASIDQGLIDVVGGYIKKALQTLSLGFRSYNVFSEMATQAQTQLKLPDYFLTIILSAVLVMIMFIFISAMVKRDL